MKKVKNIGLGDKVFAKVKGYPAWPARIEEDLAHGKKYKVYFYGTGETGIVKPEDIHLYSEKDSFLKYLKRKDYCEAMAQIEAAVAEDDATGEIPVEAASDAEKEEEKRGVKRKLSVDSTSSESKSKKAAKSTPVKLRKPTEPEKSHTDEEAETAFSDSNKTTEHKLLEESNSEEEYMAEISRNRGATNSKATKFRIITPQILRDIIEEFERFVKDAEKGNEKPEDDPYSETSNEVLLVRATPDKYIGIKLNQNRPDKSFETEVERLRWKESDARTALTLKEKVEEGVVIPEDNPDLFEFDLELTGEQQHDAIQDRIMERKRAKLRFLKTEASLVELDAAIKTNLALDKAHPKEALKDLDIMLGINIEPLMLKKHSHVMEMVKRLRRYIGNVKEWKIDGKELDDFKKNAENIRAKADIVYNKFKSLFKVTDGKTFWEVFSDECDQFKLLTKDMSENQMFILCAEPGSKQARLDEIDDLEEMKYITAQNEKKVQDKENSSQVLNSEESFTELTTETPNLTNTDSHG